MLSRTDPDLIWMVWSGFGQIHLVRKQAGVQESSGPVSGWMQSVSHFQTRFVRSSADVPDNTVQNQPGCDLVLADCVRSGSKPMCKNHPTRFWPILANRIRHVYWDY